MRGHYDIIKIMDKDEIQQKATELNEIMKNYKGRLSELERQLFDAITEYQKALEQERIKEIKDKLVTL